MSEKCVCHLNGYRLKDTEARQKAAAVGQMANAAMEKAVGFDQRITAAETTANKAKTTADGAVVTAKAAYTTAKAAETAARAAEDTAAAALPKKGGIMLGDVNMNGNSIGGATQIVGNRLGGHLLDLQYIPPNGVNTGQKRALFRVTPDGNGESLKFSIIPWNGEEYDPAAATPAALRGVDTPALDTDAANKKYVDDVAATLREEFFNMNATTMKIAATASDVNANHIVSGVVLNVKTELVEEEE